MYQENSFRIARGACLSLLLAVVFLGCDQGPTSGGDDRFEGSELVGGDTTTGKIVLDVDTTELRVGEGTHFEVAVYDAQGKPVPNISVTCEPYIEDTLTVTEPPGGVDLTNSRGVMSGRVVCSFAGSYQLGCRLPGLANRRQFVGMKCIPR